MDANVNIIAVNVFFFLSIGGAFRTYRPLLDNKGTKMYLSMVEQLQWLVLLGWFDIFSVVVTMSCFRLMPRE